MGGYEWAHVHPAPAVLGHGICADPKFFWGVGEIEDEFGNKPV